MSQRIISHWNDNYTEDKPMIVDKLPRACCISLADATQFDATCAPVLLRNNVIRKGIRRKENVPSILVSLPDTIRSAGEGTVERGGPTGAPDRPPSRAATARDCISWWNGLPTVAGTIRVLGAVDVPTLDALVMPLRPAGGFSKSSDESTSSVAAPASNNVSREHDQDQTEGLTPYYFPYSYTRQPQLQHTAPYPDC